MSWPTTAALPGASLLDQIVNASGAARVMSSPSGGIADAADAGQVGCDHREAWQPGAASTAATCVEVSA